MTRLRGLSIFLISMATHVLLVFLVAWLSLIKSLMNPSLALALLLTGTISISATGSSRYSGRSCGRLAFYGGLAAAMTVVMFVAAVVDWAAGTYQGTPFSLKSVFNLYTDPPPSLAEIALIFGMLGLFLSASVIGDVLASRIRRPGSGGLTADSI